MKQKQKHIELYWKHHSINHFLGPPLIRFSFSHPGTEGRDGTCGRCSLIGPPFPHLAPDWRVCACGPGWGQGLRVPRVYKGRDSSPSVSPCVWPGTVDLLSFLTSSWKRGGMSECVRYERKVTNNESWKWWVTVNLTSREGMAKG